MKVSINEQNHQGLLYIIATPIGNLDDISARAISVLASVDRIAAEDTRHSARLLKHFGISVPCTSYHDHAERQLCVTLIDQVKQGANLALISDAGTPLINDPGYHLVKLAHEQGITVVPIPGACAAITALSASGLPSDRFTFEGYLPSKSTARCKKLQSLLTESRTMIFYETPHRIVDALKEVVEIFGEDRMAVVARELTKRYETIKRDSVGKLYDWVANDNNQQKGEFVLLLEGVQQKAESREVSGEADRILGLLLDELPASQAAALASKITGVKKNLLYKHALDRD